MDEVVGDRAPGQMVGYARVSSSGQDLGIQVAALEKAGVDCIFQEKKSGTKMDGRTELARCLQYLREGDVLVVMKVDRLGRSLVDLARIVDNLQKRGIRFRTLDADFDADTPAGNAMLQMLMIFAELENAFRKDRQREGINAAKERGVYARPRSIRIGRKTAVAKQYLAQGYSMKEAAEKAGMHWRTLYKTAPEYRTPMPRKNKRVKDESLGLSPRPVDTAAMIAASEMSKRLEPVDLGVSPVVPPMIEPPRKGILGKLFGR